MSEELTIPAFCIMTPEARKAAWARYDAAHPKEETMKVGDKEEQLRKLKAERVTRRPDPGTAARRAALDQALAAAQGRTLDAALLGPRTGTVSRSTIEETGTLLAGPNLDAQEAKNIAAGVGLLNDGTLNIVSTTTTPTASAAAKPQEKTMTTKAKLKNSTAATKPLTAKQRGKSANASTTKAKTADARARKTEPKARAKKSAETNARTPVASTRPDGLRADSKQAQMLDLALRDEGATEKAICAELGWKKCRVTLKRVAEKVGAKLEGKKNVAGETVWFATMPKNA